MMRGSRRPVVLMGLGWLAVVAVAAALTFAAIDSAGRSVGQPLSAPAVTARLLVADPTGTGRAPRSVTPTPVTRSPSASAPPTSAPPASPAARPSAPGAGGPTPTATAEPSPTSSPAPSTSPGPPARGSQPTPPFDFASFRTDGGSVTASCRGTLLRLTAIAPLNGWRFQQESDDDHLDVTFTDGDHDLEVGLTCVAGVPTQVRS